MEDKFTIVFHGGAGLIPRSVDPERYYSSLRVIADKTFQYAKENLSNSGIGAVDVVEFAVCLFEDDPNFNAGYGAVYTADETHEMEASLMSGADLKCGAVSMIKHIKHPISLARTVMEKTCHVCLVGDGAERLAKKHNFDIVPPNYFDTIPRYEQLKLAKEIEGTFNDHDLIKPNVSSTTDSPIESSLGTVGCVCLYKGHLAAGTSTGGMTNKLSGRMGDSPINGAGNYANDQTCAVSCTGKGEEFMRHVVAHDLHCRMLYTRSLLRQAAQDVISSLPPLTGGLVAVDAAGTPVMRFNSLGMIRGWVDQTGSGELGIWENCIPLSV
eukprot:CAMPEP_0185017444 /NCGR_PEP_ID=MMETSP1103-20130426/400_1 /TAXON_ID=36769 /ORGANISM="Paraphysomonas bandaiensis, Strain Caron Lab Isolate" /LENGTH=325 /DNA_ID=CAMNT_0027546863 /DNA_START=42 /DNA_END=1016 /DNA_ORIENTATION=-